MGVSLSSDDSDTTMTLDAWMQENGPRWAEQVRALFGDSAEDALAMVLGGAT